MVAAGRLPVAGFGGRQVLGRQALLAGIATAVVVPDRRPAISMGVDMLRDVARAERTTPIARGIARLELAGLTVKRVADPLATVSKDADDYACAHGLDELRTLIDAAELAERSVEGEALKIAALADAAARDQALRAAAKELGVGVKALAEKIQKLRRTSAAKEREDEVASAPTGMISRQPPFVVVRREYKTRDGTVRAPGVYFEDTGPDGSTSLAWICSLLEVVGLNRSTSEDWGILLRITDPIRCP